MTQKINAFVSVSNSQSVNFPVARLSRNVPVADELKRMVLMLAVIASMYTGQMFNSVAVAQDRVWTDTSSSFSFWDIDDHWSPLGPPGASETAIFDQNATYEVWWDQFTQNSTPEVGAIDVNSGEVTFLNRTTQSITHTVNNDLTVAGSTTSLTNRGLQFNVLGNTNVDGGATIRIDGSHSAGSSLNVGGSTLLNDGTLNVEAGGVVSNTTGFIGNGSPSVGIATVTGPGSQWNNSSGLLVGTFGNGTLNVEAGGVVSNTSGFIGSSSTGVGVATVTGPGSQWNNSSSLIVGLSGNGTLNVEAGGVVSNSFGIIGNGSTGVGVATVTGPGSQWNNSSSLFVGSSGNGTLNVEAGGLVSNSSGFIGDQSTGVGVATVTGPGSQWNNSSSLDVGLSGNGTLNVEAGGVVSNSFGIIGNGSTGVGVATVTGPGSQWNNSSSLFVGSSGNGTLNVEAGGLVSNSSGFIGDQSTGVGVATVTGPGSQWNNSSTLRVGRRGNGTLNVEAGGVVSNTFGSIGTNLTGVGVATVTGPGAQWNSSSSLYVGSSGNGTLNVEAGGVVSNTSSIIGNASTGVGVATVTGPGSQWNNSGDLQIAAAGTGTLNIADNGLVSVGGTTTIGNNGSVTLTGGRFEFGTTTHDDLTRINATGGSLAGAINISGINDVASFSALQNPLVDLTDVNLTNSGLLVGSAILGSSLDNQAGGELMTNAGQQVIFAGNLTNTGEINNSGGTVRFEKAATNNSGGFVGGRGVFGAGNGWTNEGVMAFSGTTDILGDINNQNNGQIVTSGGATTTIFDDLIHNGLEIRTSAGSNTVIFGEATGAGAFTGTGTVFFEGDLRPGNSPGAVLFEGDVVLGSSADSFIELAGLESGMFDQLLVDGDLSLDGTLSVSLMEGFQLAFNDEFLIADVGGELFGQFNGLNEGDLVGTFGGKDLFISYTAGTGNGVSLFSAVPEPGMAGILALASLGCLMYRRPRRGRISRRALAPVSSGTQTPTAASAVRLKFSEPTAASAARLKLCVPLSTSTPVGVAGLLLGSSRVSRWALAPVSSGTLVKQTLENTSHNDVTNRCPATLLATFVVAFGLIAGSIGVSSASAQTTNWLGGNGNWFDVTNWDNGPPSQTNDAHIDNGNAINSDVLFNGTGPIGNLTIDAGDTLRIQHARVLSVEDGNNLFTNNGLIEFEGTGFTRILVDRSGVSAVDLTLDGNGTVRLTDSNHSITAIGEPTFLNGANHTIEGLGKVGNNNMRFTNQGLLHGNVSGGTLTIDSGDSFINTGTVRASNGGTVNMFSQNNAGSGLYEATGAGSTVHFFGASVSDATFNGTGGGLVFKNSAGVIDLHNVTNLGSFRAQSVRLFDSLDNQGRFTLLNGSNNNIELANDVHVTGGGTIDFAQGGSATSGAGKLFADDVTFEGFGLFETETQFAEASTLAPGTSSDATASFDFGAPFNFAGTMELQLAGTRVNNASPNIGEVNTHLLASMNALDFDQVNIFGDAVFLNNALLEIELADGFVPAQGDFFDVLTANQLHFIENLEFDLPVINGLTFEHQVLTLFDPSVGGDRDVLRFSFGATAVPEPNTFLFGSLLVLAALTSRQFRKRQELSGEKT